VASSTPTTEIKQQLTGYAQETIEHINSLSAIAFGDVKFQGQSSHAKLETETLTAILLDMLRQNIKLYGSPPLTQKPSWSRTARIPSKRRSALMSTKRKRSKRFSINSKQKN
jgi:hypothetical protein